MGKAPLSEKARRMLDAGVDLAEAIRTGEPFESEGRTYVAREAPSYNPNEKTNSPTQTSLEGMKYDKPTTDLRMEDVPEFFPEAIQTEHGWFVESSLARFTFGYNGIRDASGRYTGLWVHAHKAMPFQVKKDFENDDVGVPEKVEEACDFAVDLGVTETREDLQKLADALYATTNISRAMKARYDA